MHYHSFMFVFSRSEKLVLCNRKWACQRVFGLSMQVYGSVNSHVMDYMAKLVQAEQRHNIDNGRHDNDTFPTRYIMMHDDAVSKKKSLLLY